MYASRSRTHQQLRDLLELTEEEYGDLLANQLQPGSTAFAIQTNKQKPESDALTPKTKQTTKTKDDPDHDTTTALIAKSRLESGDDHEFEAISLDMSDDEILDKVQNLSQNQRQSLVSLHHLKKS